MTMTLINLSHLSLLASSIALLWGLTLPTLDSLLMCRVCFALKCNVKWSASAMTAHGIHAFFPSAR